MSASPRPNRPLALLGGLKPAEFMRRHWQKRPLLIRGAVAGPFPFLSRERLFALARAADVESRLVSRTERVGISRKPAQLLLERFDADGLTRRIGDARVLRRGATIDG